MTVEELMADSKKSNGGWGQHRFMALVGATIVVSLFLVAVALALYASSGAAQLDLSRPGYKSVRNQAVRSDSFNGFPSSGPINKSTLDQFRSLYETQAEKATNVDSFAGDVMSDQALSIDETAVVK
jgi:hypothetical protein